MVIAPSGAGTRPGGGGIGAGGGGLLSPCGVIGIGGGHGGRGGGGGGAGIEIGASGDFKTWFAIGPSTTGDVAIPFRRLPTKQALKKIIKCFI